MKPTLSHLHALVIAVATLLATVAATTARADAQGDPDADQRLRTLADDQERELLASARAFLNHDDLAPRHYREAVTYLLDYQEEDGYWNMRWDERIDDVRGALTDELIARYRRQLPEITSYICRIWSIETDDHWLQRGRRWFAARERHGDVTPEIRGIFFDALLDRQAATNLPWSYRDSYKIESARAAGELSDDQWDRYLRNMVSVEIEQQGSLPLGAPPRLNLTVNVKCGAATRFFCTATHKGTTIDGKAHWKNLRRRHFGGLTSRLVRPASWDSYSMPNQPATLEAAIADMHSDFRPDEYGEYPLRSEWTVRVVDVGEGLDARAFRIENTTEDIDPQSLTDEPIGDVIEFPIIIEQTVEVRPLRDVKWKTGPPGIEEILRDELIKHAFRGFITSLNETVAYGENVVVGKLDYYFDVYAVIDGEERYLGDAYQMATPSDDLMWDKEHERPHDAVFQMHRVWNAPNTFRRGPGLPERADLILRPNRFIPTLWTHDTPVWGGEIRLEDVKLHRW